MKYKILQFNDVKYGQEFFTDVQYHRVLTSGFRYNKRWANKAFEHLH